MSDADVLPAVPVHALSPLHSKAPLPPRRQSKDIKGDLPRSASFTYLVNDRETTPEPRVKRTLSENVLAAHADRSPATTNRKELSRKASKNVKKKGGNAKFELPSEDQEARPKGTMGNPNDDHGERTKTLGRTVTGTFRGLARRSWLPSSAKAQPPPRTENMKPEKKRQQSPVKESLLSPEHALTIPAPVASRSSSRSSSHDEDDTNYPEVSRAPRQAPPLETSTPPSSKSSLLAKADGEQRISRSTSASSLRSRLSMKLPTVKVPPLPQSISSDQLSATSIESPRRRDPLWAAFRALEGDYVNFQSKPGPQKAKIVRQHLNRFLSRHHDHPSNKTLRAEDLDRRVMILNKWWLGILELLNGKHSQAVPATDRPAFLEGITGIMMRPEWRIPPKTSTSGAESPQKLAIPMSKSSHSLDSTESEFLVESVHHNVRNMFIQNLVSQMAFVVERMSMRTVPASLVSFCGKACAYAFVYCPGVADILVRLWRLPTGTVRRIFAEFNVARDFDYHLATRTLAPSFPAPVRSLCVTSQTALTRHIQHQAPLPLGAAHIRWFGPWIGRWSGRDSDLLFVFAKFYHVLVAEHLPLNTPKEYRVCIPGLVPVHSQILTVLEVTLYRQAGQAHAENFTSSTAEKSDNPDVNLPLPLTIANAARSMNENRLVMLLRDVLADTSSERQVLRELYVRSFDTIIKAATRKVSLYNNDACFVLCDFMEEFLPIMSRYHQTNSKTPILDWPFWLMVCRKMMESHNTLTQVRLITFLYTTWNILTNDETRKKELVLDWILDQEFFELHFSHWCPMVRHYFHRLICWRVARQGDEGLELDKQIQNRLMDLLHTEWAHYQYLKAEAEMRDTAPPSSAACTPAPSRRFIIMRTDSQPLATAVIAALDNLVGPNVANQNSPYQSHSSVLNSLPTADLPSSNNKKRWTLFRNIIPFSSTPGNNRPGEVTPPSSSDDSDPMSKSGDLYPSTPPHRPLSFKFSLEWLERPAWPSQNRQLSPPQLPASSQFYDHVKDADGRRSNPEKPETAHQLASAKYAGRALAEWAEVVGECQGFFKRRREEGVPGDRLVETPSLGVESFRMAG